MNTFRKTVMTAALLAGMPGFAFAADMMAPPAATSAPAAASVIKMDPIPNPPVKHHKKKVVKEEAPAATEATPAAAATPAPAATPTPAATPAPATTPAPQ